MAANPSQLPVPPEPWILPTGLPTLQFYRFMVDIAALLNSTLPEQLALTLMTPQPDISDGLDEDFRALQAAVYGGLWPSQ